MKEFSRSTLNFFTLVSVLSLTLIGCATERKLMPEAVDGVIDLSGWDFEKDGIAELKGEWRFVWEEFVEPMPSQVFRDKYKGRAKVPANWPTLPYPGRAGEYLPGQGYATYVVEVRLPAERKDADLMLTSDLQSNSARYNILDNRSGSIIGAMSQGTPGTLEQNTDHLSVGVKTRFHKAPGQTIQIYLQVSNFAHARGGTWKSPALGYKKDFEEQGASRQLSNFSIFGICLIIALYHLVLFFQRREDKSTLFFALFCAFIALRLMCTGRFLQEVFGSMGQASYQWLLSLEYVSIPLLVTTFALFVNSLIPNRRLFRVTVVLVLVPAAALVLFICVASGKVFSNYILLFEIHILGTSFLAMGYLLSKAWQGDSVARGVLLATVAIVVGSVHDVLVARSMIQNPYIASYTVIVSILMQSGIISGRAARAHRQAEHLSKHLQEEVEEQTKGLRVKTAEAQEATRTALAANTELKQVNARELSHTNNLLVQSEKLSQMGAMVAGLGHEIANPIGLISMSAENFKYTTDKLAQTVMPVFTGSAEAEEAGQKIQTIIDELRDINDSTTIGSNRLKDLSMALRTQSRMDLEATPEVDLNEIVKEAMVITGGRTKVHAVQESFLKLPLITCYRSKIGQVVTNLLANAADALTEKLEASRAAGGEVFQGQILVATQEASREGVSGVVVSICDNGDGVPESIREKIFDQFFTTKPAGVGTGLGLAMCVDIVKEHGGMLSVDDDDSLGGARFELWLPIEAAGNTPGELIV
jgi:signal transduction histidine kinase